MAECEAAALIGRPTTARTHNRRVAELRTGAGIRRPRRQKQINDAEITNVSLTRLAPATALIALVLVLTALFAGTPARGAPESDYSVPGGWFYTQGGGDTPRPDDGFAVVDDGQARFWTAFQAHGGVAGVGYPISRRFNWDGFVTQVMQKSVFQWRPETGTVAFVNVFDDLSRLGFDDQLEDRLVPRPEAFAGESGLDFGQVIARRIALLDAEPKLRAAYDAVADPLNAYGLPQSRVVDYDGLRAIRLQRAVLQIWTSDFPWASAGTVTVANGGDLAKQVGLFASRQAALVPELPPESSPPPTPEPTATPVPTTADPGATDLLDALEILPEFGEGYNRSDWPHWSDLDRDGCNTRCEVLATERLADGSWHSIFDGEITSNPSSFDIDHLVPLAEAHESGGWEWDRATRQRYANDEGYEHSLIAVSDSSNRSKGKKDPAEWLPPDQRAHCFYADAWVRVKHRWSLSVDRDESVALRRILADCPAGDNAAPDPAPVTTVAPTPTVTPPVTTPEGTAFSIAGCDAAAEIVRITGAPGASLGGWILSDAGPRYSHTFGAGTTIPASGTLVVASGRASGDIKPWGQRNVWNNDGDTATLAGPGGQIDALACS